MRILFVVLVAVCSTLVLAGDGAEKVRTMMLRECQEKSGASMVDMEMIRAKRLPETKQGLCMLDCILASVKILNNGKYSKAGMMMVFTPTTKGDFTKLNKLKEFTELCEREIGDVHEECTVGKKVVECLANHGKEYGINVRTNPKSI